MGRTRDTSKILNTIESSYLTQVSASTTYATQASLATIDSDNNPDIYLNMRLKWQKIIK
jgi:hypothetical protein